MSLYNELDMLDEAQAEAERVAETMRFDSDVDRRKFVFLSLATAAATTFGFGSKVLSQGAGGAPGGGGGGGRAQQPQVPPVTVDNMEEVSWTFQPYPGGTGTLLEKTYREKGCGRVQSSAIRMECNGARRVSSRAVGNGSASINR